ncbi:MAG: methyltransferase domain-containing protein [Rhizobiaceae bacterium]|nr:methyltransferase domain-containing protein [Rhizobiaceae bacterium]
MGLRERVRHLRRRYKYARRGWKGEFPEPLTYSRRYGVRSFYRHRPDNAFFDDTPHADEYQNEVYQRAAELAQEIDAQHVVDVGCGSAFKLLKFFPDKRTIGSDLEPTVSILRERYPEREWRISDFSAQVEKSDLVICADVVEHLPNPDELMAYLVRLTGKKLVISTPERFLVYGFNHSGPPSNRAHCREWSAREFSRYTSRWFTIEEQKITNREQATQMLVCSPR